MTEPTLQELITCRFCHQHMQTRRDGRLVWHYGPPMNWNGLNWFSMVCSGSYLLASPLTEV